MWIPASAEITFFSFYQRKSASKSFVKMNDNFIRFPKAFGTQDDKRRDAQLNWE